MGKHAVGLKREMLANQGLTRSGRLRILERLRFWGWYDGNRNWERHHTWKKFRETQYKPVDIAG